MDLTPLYELRTRLRTAAIAGTGLIMEDYRLKRAVEAIRPLEAASPVFAKIGMLSKKLLLPDCQERTGTLLDLITLVDAVLCTQGAVSVAGPIKRIKESENVSETVEAEKRFAVKNIPYSVLHKLLDALQNSGSGRYGYVMEIHKKQPELFEDYRVKAAMVKALGASYAELAEQVEVWLKESNPSISSLLKEGFDPKGKKEMVRRVHVLETLCGERENAYYLEQLPDSEKAVRCALIFALRHSQENVNTLVDMTRTEKGNCKKMAFWALAYLDGPEVEAFWMAYFKKKPLDALNYLAVSEADWAGELVAKGLKELLEPWTDAENPAWIEALAGKQRKVTLPAAELEKLSTYLKALAGKRGASIRDCYRMAARVKDRLNRVYDEEGNHWVFSEFTGGGEIQMYTYSDPDYDSSYYLSEDRYGISEEVWDSIGMESHKFQDTAAILFQKALIRHPDEEMQSLALELYEKYGDLYFPAALNAKLMDTPQRCQEWVEKQVWVKNLPGTKAVPGKTLEMARALSYVFWNKKEQSYVLKLKGYNPADNQPWEQDTVIPQRMDEYFTDLLMKYSNQLLDGVMSRWITDPDSEQSQTLRAYYYDKALHMTIKDGRYFDYLRMCGAKECKGLAVRYLAGRGGKVSLWEMPCIFQYLPGDINEKREEARRVCQMIIDGKLKGVRMKPNEVEDYVNEWVRE